jgi:hypothetical protein
MILLIGVDFDRHWYAVQRPERIAARPRCVCRVGCRQGLFVHAAHDGIQLPVHRVHARKAGADRLPARCLADSDQPG